MPNKSQERVVPEEPLAPNYYPIGHERISSGDIDARARAIAACIARGEILESD